MLCAPINLLQKKQIWKDTTFLKSVEEEIAFYLAQSRPYRFEQLSFRTSLSVGPVRETEVSSCYNRRVQSRTRAWCVTGRWRSNFTCDERNSIADSGPPTWENSCVITSFFTNSFKRKMCEILLEFFFFKFWAIFDILWHQVACILYLNRY